jgi:hypothetical protein
MSSSLISDLMAIVKILYYTSDADATRRSNTFSSTAQQHSITGGSHGDNLCLDPEYPLTNRTIQCCHKYLARVNFTVFCGKCKKI